MNIDKNIPLPRRNSDVEYADVLERMDVGDSILAPSQQEALRVYHWFRCRNQKVATRAQWSGGVYQGHRVWRVQ
jgi:hypothetical protein